MKINDAIEELKETWGYDTTELNHIRELLEEVSSSTYRVGYEDGRIDSTGDIFASYGRKEDWN